MMIKSTFELSLCLDDTFHSPLKKSLYDSILIFENECWFAPDVYFFFLFSFGEGAMMNTVLFSLLLVFASYMVYGIGCILVERFSQTVLG